jgi:hypothetical protein
LSLGRWKFWKQSFYGIAKMERLDKSTSNYARSATDEMRRIEVNDSSNGSSRLSRNRSDFLDSSCSHVSSR